MNNLHHSTTASEDRAQAALDISALVAADSWQTLSPAIRRRFACGHADVSYAGEMELSASLVGRLFSMAATLVGSPLAASHQHAVAATVKVRNDGMGGVIWERLLGHQCVRSTKRVGPDGTLEECTAGGLSMRLEVFVEDGALVFSSRGYFLLIGKLRLPVPAWLTPGTCRVEHRDVGPGQFRFTMDMRHPIWGHTFHQTGVFNDPQI